MDYSIKNYKMKKLHLNNKILKLGKINVLGGNIDYINIYIKEDLDMILSKEDNLKYKVILPNKLTAPIKKGEAIGVCKVMINGKSFKVFDIRSKDTVRRVRFLDIFNHVINNYLEFNVTIE